MTERTTQTAMQSLLELGQSVWLDYLRRGMLRSGELQSLIDDGLRGMTSNPTIFEHAIGGSSDYDDDAESARRIAERATWRSSSSSPWRTSARRPTSSARCTTRRRAGTASSRWRSRPRSPATPRGRSPRRGVSGRAGGPAQRDDQGARHQGRLARDRAPAHRGHQHQHHPALLAGALSPGGGGVHAGARGSARARAGHRSAGVGGLVLRQPGRHRDRSPHRGQGRRAARSPGQGRHRQRPAGLRLVSRTRLRSARWQRLARPAPGPSGCSGPAPAPRTRTTPTCSTWTRSSAPTPSTRCRPRPSSSSRTTGPCARTLPEDASEAGSVMERLAAGGVDFADVTRALEDDGIEKFAKSFETLLGVIGTKRKALVAQAPPQAFRGVPGARRRGGRPARRHATWPSCPSASGPAIRRCGRTTPTRRRSGIGWAGSRWARRWPSRRRPSRPSPTRCARSSSRVVLCGMGGSSLAPEVLWRTFGAAPGHPALHVLDSTDPRAVRQAEQGRSGQDAVHHLEQVGNHPGERQLLPLFLGAHRRHGARSSSRSPIPARRSSGSPASAASAGPSSIRPTSAAATRRCRSSAWCRRR